MSHNLTTVRAIYEAFGKGDVPTILEQMAPDVQWETWADNRAQQAGVPWLQVRQGKEGVLDFFQYLGAEMQVTDFQVLSFMEGGNQVAVEFVIEANMPALGTHFRDEELHLWTFNAEGKVTRLRHYTDTAKHIAAAKGG
ncbi:MAG: nuclear transport factor 2 family protein [Caldilineaceae bacterium]